MCLANAVMALFLVSSGTLQPKISFGWQQVSCSCVCGLSASANIGELDNSTQMSPNSRRLTKCTVQQRLANTQAADIAPRPRALGSANLLSPNALAVLSDGPLSPQHHPLLYDMSQQQSPFEQWHSSGSSSVASLQYHSPSSFTDRRSVGSCEAGGDRSGSSRSLSVSPPPQCAPRVDRAQVVAAELRYADALKGRSFFPGKSTLIVEYQR